MSKSKIYVNKVELNIDLVSHMKTIKVSTGELHNLVDSHTF